MTYQPCLDDAEHISELDRQRFVILRPAPDVSRIHGDLQRVLRQRLSGLAVSYPVCAHVTLAGFAAGTRLDEVQDLVGSWAREVSALRIEIERVTCFPSPFQIAILQVRKTSELLIGLKSLRRRAEERQLGIATPISPDDWVFHMSLAYCSKLTLSAWDQLTQFLQTLQGTSTRCMVEQAEVVAFDGGREYSGGVYPLMAHET